MSRYHYHCNRQHQIYHLQGDLVDYLEMQLLCDRLDEDIAHLIHLFSLKKYFLDEKCFSLVFVLEKNSSRYLFAEPWPNG